jgi:hypothetical protein
MSVLALALALSLPCSAAPSFAGLWDSTYGRLRLTQDGARVNGAYSYAEGSISGTADGGRLVFRYEDQAKGEGEFELSADGSSFSGRWRADGDPVWREWKGARVRPIEGLRWLVVLEARWETSLAEPEYSYGEMLREFFRREPAVSVRHRNFTGKEHLAALIREATFLAEPTVLYVSAHGTDRGPNTDTGPADAATIAAAVKDASNLILLHFGSCDVLKGPLARDLQSSLSWPLPVSGFAQTVDWAASAVVDFMYLDLILARGQAPKTAAAELARVMPFAARASGKAGYDGVSFRFVEPRGGGR